MSPSSRGRFLVGRRPAGLDPEQSLYWYGWVVCESGCWEFGGPLHKDGYGAMQSGKTKVRASRVAYRLWVGDLEPDDKVLHHCDNPPCINPEHLFKGTQRDNIADMVAKGRNVSPQPLAGDLSPNRKLNSVDVVDIRTRASEGKSMTELASEFCVSYAAIYAIVTRRNWKSVG